MRVFIRAQLKKIFIYCGINSYAFKSDEEYIRSIANELIRQPRVFGEKSRLQVGSNVVLNDALINLSSGNVIIGDCVFTGHGVSLLTGTHNYFKKNMARQTTIPDKGRDIVIGSGVWIASNATIIGPCVIGENSVIAAGSVVTGNVPSNVVFAGVPAALMQEIKYE